MTIIWATTSRPYWKTPENSHRTQISVFSERLSAEDIKQVWQPQPKRPSLAIELKVAEQHRTMYGSTTTHPLQLLANSAAIPQHYTFSPDLPNPDNHMNSLLFNPCYIGSWWVTTATFPYGCHSTPSNAVSNHKQSLYPCNMMTQQKVSLTLMIFNLKIRIRKHLQYLSFFFNFTSVLLLCWFITALVQGGEPSKLQEHWILHSPRCIAPTFFKLMTQFVTQAVC